MAGLLDDLLISTLTVCDAEQLKKECNLFYSGLCKMKNNDNAFGINGAKEYIAACVLTMLAENEAEKLPVSHAILRKSLTEYKTYIWGAMSLVVSGDMSPLQFSNFMEELTSKVPNILSKNAWNNGYLLVERIHKWTQQQSFSREKYKGSNR